MADITNTTLRTDVEQMRYLLALLNEYGLYQHEITALSTVGFLVHANVEMNDGVLLRTNQAIKESHVVTARKMSSLYKHARNVDIFPTYAIPASMNFVLVIEEKDFLANATKTGDIYSYTLSIDNFITVGAFIYSFDYPIEIRLEEGSKNDKFLTANYIITGDLNPVSDLTNPTLKAVRQREKNGYVYQIYVKLKQYHREYYPKTVSNRDNDVFHISTQRDVDEIAGITVYHINNGTANKGASTRLEQKMFFESSRTDTDTIFLMFNDAHNFRLIHKSQKGGFRPNIGDTIYTTLYLTTGSAGNFTFGYSHGRDIKFRYADDNNMFITPWIPDSIASGGVSYANNKETLRKNIIVKQSTRDSIVVENDLYMILNNRTTNGIKNFNTYTVIKNRNDIIKVFNIFTSLNFVYGTDTTEYNIPTNTINVKWNFVDDGVKIGSEDFYMLNRMYVESHELNKGNVISKTGIEALDKKHLKYRIPFLLAYDKPNNIVRAYDNYIDEEYKCEYNLITSDVPFSYICNWVKFKKDDYYAPLDVEFQVRINVAGETPKEPLLKVNPATKKIEDGGFMEVRLVLFDKSGTEVYNGKCSFNEYVKNNDDDYFTYNIRLINPLDTKVDKKTVQLTNPKDNSTQFVPIEGLTGSIEILSPTKRSPSSQILDIDKKVVNRFTFNCDLIQDRSEEFKLQHNVLGNNEIEILQLPLVEKEFYDNHKDIYRNAIKKEYSVNQYLSKFQGEFSYSFKFTNSYGFSTTYSIGLDKKDLNNVMLDMEFIVERKQDSTLDENTLARAIYVYLNSLNFLNYDEFHISNLYDFLLGLFPNDISLIQFVGMNGYPENAQLITSKISNIHNDTIIEKITLPLVYDAENDKFNFKIKINFV